MPSFAKWLLVFISGCLSAFILTTAFFLGKEIAEPEEVSGFGLLVLLFAGLLCTNILKVNREIQAVSRWLISGVVFIPLVFIFAYVLGHHQTNSTNDNEAASISSDTTNGSASRLSDEDEKIFDDVDRSMSKTH